jgi:hypothetical protein
MPGRKQASTVTPLSHKKQKLLRSTGAIINEQSEQRKTNKSSKEGANDSTEEEGANR